MESSFMFRLFFLLILLSLLILPGCGRRDGLVEVSGTITVNGESVDKGVIQFVPATGVGQEGGGIIKDGNFTARVSPGENIVRVDGAKVTGTREVSPLPGTVLKVDIEKPLTTRKKHWDNSTYRVTVDKKNEPFKIEL
jgi:hypothetical protein